MNETLKTLIDISNNKTKEFNTECEKAKDAQKELIDRAWTKIEDYLISILDMGFQGYVEIPNLYLYWPNQNKGYEQFTTRFSFDKQVSIHERSYASGLHLTIRDKNIHRDSTDFTYCVKRMVTKWSEIKPKLEEALQQTLTERMNKAEREKDSVKEMNNKLASFEV